MCSITTGLNAAITSTNSTVSTITTFLGSTTKFNNSANCLTALGGTATDSAHATIGYLTTKVCAVDTTVNAIPSYIKTDSVALNWVGCFGSAPYSYANTATTIQTQLQRIVAVLNAEKTAYSADFVVTTAGCGSKIVSLAPTAAFSCSSLSTCSIDSLGDVVITAPSNPHVLYYNGTNWVNKNINALVTMSSTDGTIAVTTTTTAGNVNYDLSVLGLTATRANLTAIAVSGANNTFNGAFPATPGSGYALATKQGSIVTLSGSIELVVTSGLTLSSGSSVPLATVPAGYRPVAGSISFYCRVFKKATAPYTDPDGSFDARITIDTAGTLIMIPFPVYPAASLILSTVGSKVEVLLGAYTYSVLP
jgi:hypothetical protein